MYKVMFIDKNKKNPEWEIGVIVETFSSAQRIIENDKVIDEINNQVERYEYKIEEEI